MELENNFNIEQFLDLSNYARRRCSEAGKKNAKIKKCYIDENGNEVWMRPSNKSQHHPNWKLKI